MAQIGQHTLWESARVPCQRTLPKGPGLPWPLSGVDVLQHLGVGSERASHVETHQMNFKDGAPVTPIGFEDPQGIPLPWGSLCSLQSKKGVFRQSTSVRIMYNGMVTACVLSAMLVQSHKTFGKCET